MARTPLTRRDILDADVTEIVDRIERASGLRYFASFMAGYRAEAVAEYLNIKEHAEGFGTDAAAEERS